MPSYKDYMVGNLSNAEVILDENVNVKRWIKDLQDEGYEINRYAVDILEIFGGVYIKGSHKNANILYELYFNPVHFASGEFDRMETFNRYAKDILFPIGGAWDSPFYVGAKGNYYISDCSCLYYCGDSFEYFLQNMASERIEIKELYDYGKKIAIESLINELGNITELNATLPFIMESVQKGEYQIAVENMAKNILEVEYILDATQKQKIIDLLKNYNEECDKKLIEDLKKQNNGFLLQ